MPKVPTRNAAQLRPSIAGDDSRIEFAKCGCNPEEFVSMPEEEEEK